MPAAISTSPMTKSGPPRGADRADLPIRQLDPAQHPADHRGDHDQQAPPFCLCPASVEVTAEAHDALAQREDAE
jgi:hypothetical protein